ncbi:13545_t:CDS:1, partial [Funneliformis geosporum]
SSKVPKKRLRAYDYINFYEKEQTRPFQTPKLTINNYKDSLKMAIQNACIE